MALLVCTYYGAILHQLRDKWWIKDGGMHLVDTLACEISQTTASLSAHIEVLKLHVGLPCPAT